MSVDVIGGISSELGEGELKILKLNFWLLTLSPNLRFPIIIT